VRELGEDAEREGLRRMGELAVGEVLVREQVKWYGR
jgi:hypothetical protein